YLKEPVHGV
nr:Chain C, HIV-RT VARIANT PEPTIDE I1Y (YLKEPVHGV) [synthetic construct]1I1Y_F Chain F, HIV-RT VARIANT PEPTIDE I1Y (YLKEPVHGV) [synthetic construct]